MKQTVPQGLREPGTRKRPERSWSRRKTSFRRKAEEGYLRRSENPPASAVGSVNYLCISAYSYPMLAIYNAGAALYRSFGKASTTMYISIVSNIVNVVGNCIGVFLLHAGVEGVAWPSLISRTLSAVLITMFCFSENNPVQYVRSWIFKIDGELQKKILRIAVPNGIESGLFQLVKVALSSIAALFGAYQIAANGVAQSIWTMAALVSVSMGPAYITVIGQCMGARDIEQAEFYFRKLTKITLAFSIGWNILIFAVTPPLVGLYALSEKTKRLTIQLVLIHNAFNALAFTFADPLGKGLRATGDVFFTTAVSLFTTIVVRLLFSIILGICFNMGVIGIALAMGIDWTVRGIIFWVRFRRNAWKKCHVI
ncbi:MAG: MATE family efflux transporter [Olsenella sp.]|jgi:putative MATE family efflux protein